MVTIGELKEFIKMAEANGIADSVAIKVILKNGNIKEADSCTPWSMAAGGPAIYLKK